MKFPWTNKKCDECDFLRSTSPIVSTMRPPTAKEIGNHLQAWYLMPHKETNDIEEVYIYFQKSIDDAGQWIKFIKGQ